MRATLYAGMASVGLSIACSDSAASDERGGAAPWSTGAGATAEQGGAGAAGEGGGPAAQPRALTVRIGSTRATRIDLFVYAAPRDVAPVLSRRLDPSGEDAWEATVTADELAAAGITDVAYYGVRAWGPNWPFDPSWEPGSEAGFIADVDDEGNRFNPNKLLLDPRAEEISHDPSTPEMLDGSVYRTGPDDRSKDSGPVAPKGVFVVAPAPGPAVGEGPTGSLAADTIYEVHVRGFTMSDPGVEAACRGTYRAAAEKAAYLADLGVTAIELLPIQETQNATNDLEASTSGDNYWGYSTLGFFAPDRRYACDASPGGPTREVKEMVAAMHAHGIKVFMDVVYNHTAEGGVGDPSKARLLSLRGLDNAGYYELANDAGHFADNTGVGANTNAKSTIFRDLVLDSLSYWHDVMGIDGFRFDLASVLANGCERSCFDFDPGDEGGILARAIAELPARAPEGGAGVDLVAEPWGIGPGTYQLGSYPKGFAEWNGRYRDTIRRDQNRLDVEAVTPREVARRVAGSRDLYGDDGRTPAATVNYLVSHDGFSLRDLYSCNQKDNGQPWPYGPSDGGEDNNLSWDYGGDASRQRQADRTGLALLSLSAGAVMITGGDELYRTQACNNNAYNLDSVANWLDWQASGDEPAQARFARLVLRFRRDHASLTPIDWPSWTFVSETGAPATDAYLDNPNNHFLGYRIDAGAAGEDDRSILVLYNGHKAAVPASIPAAAEGHRWVVAIDTSSAAEASGNIFDPGAEPDLEGVSYEVKARSVVVLLERPGEL